MEEAGCRNNRSSWFGGGRWDFGDWRPGLGVVAVSWPERTFEVLVLLFGVLNLLVASGALSLAFGVVFAIQPGLGVVAPMWLLGAYASLFGILLVLLALRLYRWRPPAPPSHSAEPPTESSAEQPVRA